MRWRHWWKRAGHSGLIKICSAWLLDCVRECQVTGWQPPAGHKVNFKARSHSYGLHGCSTGQVVGLHGRHVANAWQAVTLRPQGCTGDGRDVVGRHGQDRCALHQQGKLASRDSAAAPLCQGGRDSRACRRQAGS